MNQDVLETARFPEIVFESSKVSASKAGDGQYRVNLVGDLTLHGVKNSQPVSSAGVPSLGNMLRAHGEFSVSQERRTAIKPLVGDWRFAEGEGRVEVLVRHRARKQIG